MKRSTIAGIVLGVMMGAALGVGAYTFIYAKGGSYMTNDPKACVNCHVMQEQYDGWINSSHRSVATCNDCHAPHDLVGKYMTKAQNGFWHSLRFTTGDFPEHIQINERNRKITENACRSCHADIVETIEAPLSVHSEADKTSCLRCHRSVGHMH